MTRNPVPPEVLRSWRPQPACHNEESSEETDDEANTSSDSDPPPLPSILPILQHRRSLRNRSEEQVEQDIISISGRI